MSLKIFCHPNHKFITNTILRFLLGNKLVNSMRKPLSIRPKHNNYYNTCFSSNIYILSMFPSILIRKYIKLDKDILNITEVEKYYFCPSKYQNCSFSDPMSIIISLKPSKEESRAKKLYGNSEV